MKPEYTIQKGKTYPVGINLIENGIQIAIPVRAKKNCGILLKGTKKGTVKIPFPKQYKIGDLYALEIIGEDFSGVSYQIFGDDKTYASEYATAISGKKKWGTYHKDNSHLKGILFKEEYDWEEDAPLQIPYHESILYHSHIRGFTKHNSSNVSCKGTFLGAVEKLPYLKELGVTGVCFMPMYEFDELIHNPAYIDVKETVAAASKNGALSQAALSFMSEDKKTWKYKINYWGFSDGFYFAPKASYAETDRPDIECKDMIKAFHKAGIEVIMQMYFTPDMTQEMIYHIVRFWVEQYHVDGFFLQGYNIPKKLLCEDAVLSGTKLIFEAISEENDLSRSEGQTFKNVSYIDFDFMYDARKFLKGDEDMLQKMAVHFRKNPSKLGVIHQITAYNTFTLNDLVSYDRKHNEANMEDNRDGNDYNYSWNCGVEGASRKRHIVNLRNKQMRNAICMLLFGQATPMLLSGDEFGMTHGGNNNPYCQDNKTNWLNWNLLVKNAEFFSFVKDMISLRKNHPILHKEEEFKIMDYISCGYPDLSYHGEMAWYPEFANYNRHIGIMYCGKYAKRDRVDDDFIYVLYNMHWTEHDFALPKLPEGMKWSKQVDTLLVKKADDISHDAIEGQIKVTLPPRCIWILKGSKDGN